MQERVKGAEEENKKAQDSLQETRSSLDKTQALLEETAADLARLPQSHQTHQRLVDMEVWVQAAQNEQQRLSREAEADREQSKVVIAYMDSVRREMNQLRQEVNQKVPSKELIELNDAVDKLRAALNGQEASNETKIDATEHALQSQIDKVVQIITNHDKKINSAE